MKERIQILEKRLEELKRQVGMNSQNSSKPPSSDPPSIRTSLPKRRRKKRGAKNGHPPHLRTLLSSEWVKKRIPWKPHVCPWRKGSFGTQRERGARNVERILTVWATCRLQKRSVIDYLRDACRRHLKGIAVPSFIKTSDDLQKSARTLTNTVKNTREETHLRDLIFP